MPYWGQDIHWDGTARWAPVVPQITIQYTMAIIATNTSKLPLPGKIVKGQEIITMSTANPAVPGNGAVLTAFTNAQEDLISANDAYVAAQGAVQNLLAVRKDAIDAWNAALNVLASFTGSATQGDPTAILSTGFDVRGTGSPPQPVAAPDGIKVMLNGTPGNTKLSWTPVHGAASYLVEMSPDPATDTSWVQVATPTKARCEVGGSDPGKVYWFRIAAVSASGTGPWSGQMIRQVM